MKCNPSRWLWGLLPLTLLWWIGLLGNQPRVESELTQRVNEHLERSGLGWAKVAFKGRDGTLQGRAEEESEQRRPSIEAAKVWGVRALDDRIEVLQLIKNYLWSATDQAGTVRLAGYVPNEAARKAILGSVRSTFPKHKVDDKMELARGAPDQKQWLGGTAFALRQLAALKNGGRVALEGAGYVIEGEAESSKSYETVRTALTKLPAGISLKTDKVAAPVVSPYTWAAALRGRQIELTGHAPSLAARDAIKQAAGRAMSGANVVDRMLLASGAPADWQRVATATLSRLGQLKQGTAELRDRQVTITGITETEETADTVRRAIRTDIPIAFRVTEDIKQDPVVKAAEEARRRAAEEAARRAAAEAEARRLAEEARRRAAEEAAKRAAAEAEARRVAELQRQQDEAAARARAAAEAEARQRMEQQRQQAEAEARRRASETEADARKRTEADAEARRRAEQQRQQAEAEARKRAEAEEEARRRAEQQRQQAEADARRRVEEERARNQVVAVAPTPTPAPPPAPSAPSAAQHRTAEGQRCQAALTSAVDAGNINFKRASADLDDRSHRTLNALAVIVKGCPGFEIEIGGHTDNEGEPGRNQRLSERRARSVVDYLIKAGVPQGSLSAVGYGEAKPKVPNDSPANMAINRRIEFSVRTR